MSGAPRYIARGDAESELSWRAVIDALMQGHRRPRARISDLLLPGAQGGFLNRAAWIEGFGLGVKSVTIFPGNPLREPARPTVQGVFLIFDDETGALEAVIDGALITHWKTAADSVLGAQFLARPEPRRLFVMGAGAVARALIEAYAEIFPSIERVDIWSRRHISAQALAGATRDGLALVPIEDARTAAGEADIIVTATAAKRPILFGEWVARGTHVDLVGAFGPDMREADDALLQKARIFVDSRETTLTHIGELKIPLEQKVLSLKDIRGDLYDLAGGAPGRLSPEDVTVYKNGGGAHLDLMVARLIYQIVAGRSAA